MAVLERTLSAFKEEGFDKPGDIFKFSKYNLESIFDSLSKPPGKLVNRKDVTVAFHVISVKSRKQIAVAA